MNKKKILSLITAASLFCGSLGTVSACAADSNGGDKSTGSGAKNSAKTAEEIVSGMTLEQKIAQMIMIECRYWSDTNSYADITDYTALNQPFADLLEKYSIGGVILFDENIKSTEQTIHLINDLQAAAAKNENKIPLFIAADQEGGSIIRLGTGTNTCGNMALGATADPDCAYENADIIGSELAAFGINVDFAPVMDVNSNPKNPVINIRSFSSDPAIVGEMGKAYIAGLMKNNIIGSAKHFPGHGDTDVDSHTGLPLIDKSYEELKKCDLIPFKEAIEAGVDMIMTTHIQFQQIEKGTYTSISTGKEVYLPATLSKTVLTDILRRDMGYDGVIITDGMLMNALTKNFDIYDTAELAINAGNDMLLVPFDTFSAETVSDMYTYIGVIEKKVESGRISEDRINESAKRIVDLKLKRGLFDNDYENEDVDAKVANALATVGSFEHHEKELEVTNKAMTLVKNENNVLPLKLEADEKALFFYANGNADKSFSFAFDRLKKSGTVPEGASVDTYFYPDKPAADYADEVEKAKAVIIASDSWGENYFYPSDDYNGAEAKFIDEMTALAHEKGKSVIVVSIMYPYDAGRFTDADAFLIAYGRKMMSEIPTEYNGQVKAYGPNLISAIITVFGGNTPTGKLPVDVYEIDDNYKYTDKVLYPLGFGLTYESEKEPDDSTPDESTPDSSAPDDSKPDESTPDSSAPDDSKPDESEPDSSAPDDSIPDIITPHKNGVEFRTYSGGSEKSDESSHESNRYSFRAVTNSTSSTDNSTAAASTTTTAAGTSGSASAGTANADTNNPDTGSKSLGAVYAAGILTAGAAVIAKRKREDRK